MKHDDRNPFATRRLQPWTTHEVKELEELYKDGFKLSQIAYMLNVHRKAQYRPHCESSVSTDVVAIANTIRDMTRLTTNHDAWNTFYHQHGRVMRHNSKCSRINNYYCTKIPETNNHHRVRHGIHWRNHYHHLISTSARFIGT